MAALLLNERQVDAIEDAAGETDVKVRWGYSGRGMYGKTCLGIDVDYESEYSQFLITLAAMDGELAAELAGRERRDAMGLGRIIYFPGVQREGAEHDTSTG